MLFLRKGAAVENKDMCIYLCREIISLLYDDLDDSSACMQGELLDAYRSITQRAIDKAAAIERKITQIKQL